MSCVWFWDGIRWVESPYYPHNCPDGQHCDSPTADGSSYGEQDVTLCRLGPP